MEEKVDIGQLKDILIFYDGKRKELIPILQEAQGIYGWLSEDVMDCIAKFLNIPLGQAYSVASFYNHFRLMPLGRTTVTVCRGTACHITNSSNILNKISEAIGLKEGETSPDLEYTLESVACIGCCALAPVVKINHRIYGEMTREKVESLFKIS